MKTWKLCIVSVGISMCSAVILDSSIDGVPAWFWVPYGLFIGFLAVYINGKVMEGKELERERKLDEQREQDSC